MNVLLIGGSGSLINNLIIKFNKEGHRVYLLTGTRYAMVPYQRVFERYNFPYDCSCLNEIFESIKMDLTIFLGVYDTNYKWVHEENDSVNFSAGVMNILMSYAMKNKGRFVYLSSQEVFDGGSLKNIREDDITSSTGVKSMVFAQAEEMCESYRENRALDIITLRLDHLYTVPQKREDCRDICTQMCLEAFDNEQMTVNEKNKFSLLYETDAVEYIYKISVAEKHKEQVYHISSSIEMSELDLARKISTIVGPDVVIRKVPGQAKRIVLSNTRYDAEFGMREFCDMDGIIGNIIKKMDSNKRAFYSDEEKRKTIIQRVMDRANWLIRALVPFAENMAAFIPFFMLNNRAVGSKYFANLDFYVLYVLLFAIVYGQQQATFSAVLATIGYCFRQMYTRTGFELMLDMNTYVWVAQLFILGLVVGYMRDQITKLKKESVEEQEFLNAQLKDMREINTSNVRVKDALETQIVNQNDSVGRIYSITSALDSFSQEEVLFRAADMISKLVKSHDVAIYIVANDSYARMFSATSKKARTMGNSVRYTSWGDLYDTLMEHRVFINRSLDENYPMMANAIFDDRGKAKIFIMIWTLPWECMTLGQANQFSVISALINSAVVRSAMYLEALEEKRYINGTRILEKDAFSGLVSAYQNAEREGLAECVILQIRNYVDEENYEKVSRELSVKLRSSDILGLMEDGSLYVLLANTTPTDAELVIDRLEEINYLCDIVEDGVVCLRPDRLS